MESARRTREVSGPKRVAPMQHEDTRLPIDRQLKPQPPFRLGHLPNRWEWTEDHGFLPQLTVLSAVPGVNGNQRQGGPMAKTGPVNMAGFIAGFTAKGGTYIDPNDKRLGEFQDYHTTAYERRDGALHYVMPWESLTVLPTGRIKINEEHNHAEWQRFRAHVRDSGMLEPLHYTTVVDMIDRLETRLARLESREPTAASRKQVERINEQLAGIKAAWEAHEAEVTAASGGGQTAGPKRVKTPGATVGKEAARG